MKRHLKIGLTWLIIGIAIHGCGKDIEGPTTNPPLNIGPTGPTDTNHGALMFYSDWTEFSTYCDSFAVTIDDTTRGYLSVAFDTTVPGCNGLGTVTVDSLSVGSHKVYVGDCDFIFWEMNMVVVKGECIVVPISN